MSKIEKFSISPPKFRTDIEQLMPIHPIDKSPHPLKSPTLTMSRSTRGLTHVSGRQIILTVSPPLAGFSCKNNNKSRTFFTITKVFSPLLPLFSFHANKIYKSLLSIVAHPIQPPRHLIFPLIPLQTVPSLPLSSIFSFLPIQDQCPTFFNYHSKKVFLQT